MGEYHIYGGNRISGDVKINGGKNAVLPILASVVMNAGTSVIHNCPKITDTYVSVEILKSIGCKVKMEGNTLIVNSSPAYNHEIPEHLVTEMRSSIIFLGGVLGRFKKVKISYPGGCELGLRPIDLHLKSLKALGVTILEENGFILCSADQLVGTKINLDFPSVGATENTMLAAVFAKGETILTNAAREPEIVDLQNFLNGMGAKIKGAGTDRIVIRGVDTMHDVEHTVMPDRIVAGTYMVAAAITQGKLTLENIISEHLYPVTSKLMETGCSIREEKTKLIIEGPPVPKAIYRLRTSPHPGFPTDMQPQMMALLSIAQGTSLIEETVFESRNKHIGELNKMGAEIVLSQDGMTSVVRGAPKLKGTSLTARDLRGGAALILAGLAAEGKTIVSHSKHVERGYEQFEETLTSLGADIQFYR